jgi:putative selenium metabolism hydrolase
MRQSKAAISGRLADEAIVSLAQKLIQVPSPSGQEGALAALVAEEMRQAGFDVRVDRMGNVIGRIGPGRGKKLLYDAHLDTVEAGDPSGWARPPFAAQVERGMLYGRGACDMKAALAAMIYAGNALVDSGAALDGDLYVVGVVQEEPCEGLAVRSIVEEEGIRPDWVVIGEATNLQVYRGQRGRMELCVTVQGRSAHASAPEKGVNAIYEAARAIVGLEMLSASLNHDTFLGKGSIAVTEIRSTSVSRNAVPDTCTFYVDRRLTSGETETKVLSEIRRALVREGVNATVSVSEYSGTSYTGHQMHARQHFPFWVTAEDDPLVVQALNVIEDVLGFVARKGIWDFSTDGVYTAGVAGIPTIGFGPGEERYAHTSEDQVRVRDIVSAARVYAELPLRLLHEG